MKYLDLCVVRIFCEEFPWPVGEVQRVKHIVLGHSIQLYLVISSPRLRNFSETMKLEINIYII